MFTIADFATYEEEIKKSRFVGRASAVSTPEDTFAFLEKIKDPQATHNCFAFRIGDNYRFSDDGEPKGTAGKPILTAIERQDLDHVMVVVTRYFGGIKLGAGGLTRAYGGVASMCLKGAVKKEVRPMAIARIKAGFDLASTVYALMKQLNVEKLEEKYTDLGVNIDVRLEKARIPEFTIALRDISRGAIELEQLDGGGC